MASGLNILKDAGSDLVALWKTDKVTGTLMPIFLVLNITILWTSRDWTVNQLVADAFMLVLMVWSIYQTRKKLLKDSLDSRESSRIENIRKHEVTESYRYKEMEVKLRRDEFEHRRDMERFARSIVDAEHRRKMALLEERSDFVDEQIVRKVDHILFLQENFPLDENMKTLIERHKQEIDELRAYKRSLPERVRFRYRAEGVPEPPEVNTTGEHAKKELEIVLDQIRNNVDIKEATEDISSTATSV